MKLKRYLGVGRHLGTMRRLFDVHAGTRKAIHQLRTHLC
jgi:hypothetical protein